jgi:hypothetical protein
MSVQKFLITINWDKTMSDEIIKKITLDNWYKALKNIYNIENKNFDCYIRNVEHKNQTIYINCYIIEDAVFKKFIDIHMDNWKEQIYINMKKSIEEYIYNFNYLENKIKILNIDIQQII